MELPYPPLIKIHFYQIDKYENEYFQESGISFPSDKKYSEHPYYQFPIIQQTGKIKIFLLIRAGDPLTTPIFLWNKNTLGQIDGYRHFAFGIFFGIILSLALYNFLLFYTINDRAYLYYICYILSFGFFLFLVMEFYTYILQSESSGSLYIGSTNNLDDRLSRHNNNLNTYTKGKGPWLLLYYSTFSTRSEAVQLERFLKRKKSKSRVLAWIARRP